MRRSLAVVMAGSATAVALAMPASAATPVGAPPAPAAMRMSPVRAPLVRLDILVNPASVPAGARAILVRNVTTGATIGIYDLKPGAPTDIVVTVPVGTTLDVSALSAHDAGRPANLGTVRVVVGGRGSTVAGDSVVITFRGKGAPPAAAPSAPLRNEGAKISVR
jgi:hypothetical protein